MKNEIKRYKSLVASNKYSREEILQMIVKEHARKIVVAEMQILLQMLDADKEE